MEKARGSIGSPQETRQLAVEIDRKIRALNPEPGTWTILNGKRTKLLEAKVIDEKLKITKIQVEGKKSQNTCRDHLMVGICDSESRSILVRIQVLRYPSPRLRNSNADMYYTYILLSSKSKIFILDTPKILKKIRRT